MPDEIQTPIYRQYTWLVEIWQFGKWEHTETVRTWTKTKPIAIRKAKISNPALRDRLLRATCIKVEAAPDGMTLSTDPHCERRASYYVYDDNNETRTLRKENKFKGNRIEL